MKESLERIIHHVLEDARAKGRDQLTETTLAVRAVCQARPAMSAAEAVAAVRLVQRRRRPAWTSTAPPPF
jgi:hypothetical protein